MNNTLCSWSKCTKQDIIKYVKWIREITFLHNNFVFNFAFFYIIKPNNIIYLPSVQVWLTADNITEMFIQKKEYWPLKVTHGSKFCSYHSISYQLLHCVILGIMLNGSLSLIWHTLIHVFCNLYRVRIFLTLSW